MEYMILPFRRYFDFQGRSRRMEYWMFTLMNVIVVFALMLIIFGSTGLSSLAASGESDAEIVAGLFGGMGFLLLLWFLAVLIPSIAVTVRRLHDRDMSGWWYLGFIVAGMIPYVGVIASIALLIILCLPGTAGTNRFGPDPINPTSAEVFE